MGYFLPIQTATNEAEAQARVGAYFGFGDVGRFDDCREAIEGFCALESGIDLLVGRQIIRVLGRALSPIMPEAHHCGSCHL